LKEIVLYLEGKEVGEQLKQKEVKYIGTRPSFTAPLDENVFRETRSKIGTRNRGGVVKRTQEKKLNLANVVVSL